MVTWQTPIPQKPGLESAAGGEVPHPTQLELSPHARLGRRMKLSCAIAVLLVFHTSMILIAILHWNKPAETHPALEHGPCDTRLGASLIAYGIVGLGFVYLLFREWLYFARLSALPILSNLVLLILLCTCHFVAGGFLLYYTVTLRYVCAAQSPLVYRWAMAASLFFALVAFLALAIPLVRGLARVLLAPFALCLIG